MAPIPASEIPTLSLLYKLGHLSAAPATARMPRTLLGPSVRPRPSKSFNDRVALISGDITKLAVDAIVNAANRSLLGGGGVDGAIHRAAGPNLLAECRPLNGCKTGSAKITNGYRLPARKVIHAVGPIYTMIDDPEESERLLGSCYTTSLELAVKEGCRTVAFSGLSTGAYGYPSKEAAGVALGAVRKFLEGEDGGKIEKVVLVTFERKDVVAYDNMIPLFFPPVEETETDEAKTDETTEAKLEAEAEAVASELPSPPKADPADADAEHADKRQKLDEA
ncbi:hypothetical protein OQA88_2263 [Cercophora sp. LCS_1]